MTELLILSHQLTDVERARCLSTLRFQPADLELSGESVISGIMHDFAPGTDGEKIGLPVLRSALGLAAVRDNFPGVHAFHVDIPGFPGSPTVCGAFVVASSIERPGISPRDVTSQLEAVHRSALLIVDQLPDEVLPRIGRPRFALPQGYEAS